MALTKESLSKLKCNNCKKYLSVPPISVSNGEFICGRCISEPKVRNTIYEELAKYMTFPCSNQSCPTLLKWGEAENHEKQCSHKTVACPKPNCGNYYLVRDLYGHFSSSHPELVLNCDSPIRRTLRDMPIKNFNKDKKVYLIQEKGQSYLFMVYGTCKEDPDDPEYIASYSYFFGAFYLYKDNNTKTLYDLDVTLTDENDEVIEYCWYGDLLREYNDYRHCLGCLDNGCHLGHSRNKIKMFLWNQMKNVDNDGNCILKYSINIVAEKTLPPEIITLASELECRLCCEYLAAPIYICENGHSLCSDCKEKCSRCGFCNGFIGHVRNYDLEEIADSLEICCPNSANGCKYVGIAKNTNLHMENCPF